MTTVGPQRPVPLQERLPPPVVVRAGPTDDPATSFTRRPATRWLSPRLLLRSAGEAVVSGLLGAYNDKREQMGSVPAAGYLDLSVLPVGTDALWVDYVSDTGDGFDATYAVAALLGRPELELSTRDGGTVHRTERGRLLVMGGDECYPAGSVEGYEDRLVGPYRAALPELPEAVAPHLQVVPGNHDWYDGLTAFMRTFCQGRWIGAWRTCQSRSWFATRL
ncbi:MAG: hypothetical protein JWN17_383, partial [Frankiales bacterium]|nr:hypothetical protein [Frankiales bacterium]